MILWKLKIISMWFLMPKVVFRFFRNLFIYFFIFTPICVQSADIADKFNEFNFFSPKFVSSNRTCNSMDELALGLNIWFIFFCFGFLIRICATISHRQVIRLCYHDCLRRKPRLNWNKCIILTCTTILVRTIHAFCLQTENRILKLVCMFGWMFESTIYTHHKKSYLQFFFSFVKLILK